MPSNGIDFPIHHRFEPRIGHHLGVDPVALRARLVGDPGEHHGLARLQLDAARKRGELADLDVVGDPFAVIQRAVFAPDLAGFLRHPGVGREVFLRDGDDEAIDIGHGDFLLFVTVIASATGRAGHEKETWIASCRRSSQ